MKLLCITDPKTHPENDTTVELYNRLAIDAEIEFFHLPLEEVRGLEEVNVVPIEQPLSYQEFLNINQERFVKRLMSDFDLVFSRADKPLPDDYFEKLAKFENQVKFVNRPSFVVRAGRKEFVQNLAAGFMPDAVCTRDYQVVQQFQKKFPVIVAKQNFSYGGKGVFKIWADGKTFFFDNILRGTKKFASLESLLSELFSFDPEPYQFVRFLRNIAEGDKRVLVVDGEIYGAFLRKSSKDSWVHNFTAGGRAFPADVSQFERKVIAETVDVYLENGVHTLGYDFLVDDDGAWTLSEINAGNIGGYGRLEQLSGMAVYDRLIQFLKHLISLPAENRG